MPMTALVMVVVTPEVSLTRDLSLNGDNHYHYYSAVCLELLIVTLMMMITQLEAMIVSVESSSHGWGGLL